MRAGGLERANRNETSMCGLVCGAKFGCGSLPRAVKSMPRPRVARRGCEVGSQSVHVAGCGVWFRILTRTAKSTHAPPTSPRSIGFCAIWDCISSSLSSEYFSREDPRAGWSAKKDPGNSPVISVLVAMGVCWGAVFTPVHGGRTGASTSGVAFSGGKGWEYGP